MKKLFLPVIAFFLLFSISAFAVLVENTGSGSGDVIGPATNTDQYVPQWNGADSKTLSNGFSITTQGKALVAKTSTADMVTYLGASGSSGLSGTTGYIPKFTASTTAGNSAIYQSSTFIGIGTTSPFALLNLQNGSIHIGSSSNTTTQNVLLAGYGYNDGSVRYGNTSIRSSYNNYSNSASLDFYVGTSGATTSRALTILNTGYVGIGTANPGKMLDVNGDVSANRAVFSGTVTANSVIGTYQSITISVDGGGSVPATGNLSATYHAPVNITLSDYYASCDVTGNAVIDIKRNGVSIVGAGNKPTISSNVKSTAALSSWTSTTISAGDRLTFVLDSISTCTAVNVILKGKRS